MAVRPPTMEDDNCQIPSCIYICLCFQNIAWIITVCINGSNISLDEQTLNKYWRSCYLPAGQCSFSELTSGCLCHFGCSLPLQDTRRNGRRIREIKADKDCEGDRKKTITWIFMAISLPSFNTPWCTWPMDAAANGFSSNDDSLSRQSGPSSSSRTFYTTRPTQTP